ncbi:hypothetical protein MtrunA17_Chr5g0430811 [Medicago truncatula]|uniref:Uncharacterized protein n=1 Tax=Medicago truncatula TaxID=3880 RepID=G7K737_MEDTR|nr:hypothetical protein MTR_5g071960 [Medicago truncatula]RHN56564.1 hypothetical protein MtrunA17_Chr5g0430811 [Medicago truncatula]
MFRFSSLLTKRNLTSRLSTVLSSTFQIRHISNNATPCIDEPRCKIWIAGLMGTESTSPELRDLFYACDMEGYRKTKSRNSHNMSRIRYKIRSEYQIDPCQIVYTYLRLKGMKVM